MSWDALFTVEKRAPVYRTVEAELEAIARAAKSLSFFASDRASIADDLPIVTAALKRGLATTISPRNEGVDVIVYRAREDHRVAPLQALLSSSPWTFAREEELGLQLGYSRTQRAAWMAAERFARPDYGVLTIYAVLSPAYHAARSALWCAQPGKVVDAKAVKKDGTVAWRVGMDPAFAKKLANNYAQLHTPAARTAFAKLQRTPFQRLTPSGWQSVKPTA